MMKTAQALGLAAASAVLLTFSAPAALASGSTSERQAESTRLAMVFGDDGFQETATSAEGCVAKAVTPDDGVCVVEVSCGGGARAAQRASTLSDAWWSLCDSHADN